MRVHGRHLAGEDAVKGPDHAEFSAIVGGKVTQGEKLDFHESYQAKLTFGAFRSVGSSILKSSAGWKPSAPAKMTLGNVSRGLL